MLFTGLFMPDKATLVRVDVNLDTLGKTVLQVCRVTTMTITSCETFTTKVGNPQSIFDIQLNLC